MKFIKALAAFSATFCLTQSVRAWNAEGHMVVAEIAYNHLKPAVKAKCDSLIAVALPQSSTGTSNFITAACWADDFKSTLGTGIWHYIDIPLSLDGTSTNGVVPDTFDVVRAINLCIATLQNTNSSLTDQATYLRYLIHFVGDIEQPLHCSTGVSASHPAGDAGGNDFSLKGSFSELHALWDAGGTYLTTTLNRPLSSSSQTTLSNKVADVESAYPYSAQFTTIPNPMTWAVEGWGLAGTVAYVGVTNNTTPSAAYLASAAATSKQRMAAGGERLADLLNILFFPVPTPPKLAAGPVPVNHTFQFSFTNVPGSSFSVWASTNAKSPFNAWSNIGAAMETPANSGAFQFTDPQAATNAQRYYRAQSP